jgi:translation initiation factor 1
MKSKTNDWKDRLGMVYSTNPDFRFETGEAEEAETLPPAQQLLFIGIDRKQRKGKVVTLVTGFVGNDDDLQELGRELRKKCGTGGSAKEGEIIIQGDFKDRVAALLQEAGYKIKLK